MWKIFCMNFTRFFIDAFDTLTILTIPHEKPLYRICCHLGTHHLDLTEYTRSTNHSNRISFHQSCQPSIPSWNWSGRFALLLLENGADASVISKYGDAPVHTAAPRGHSEIVRLMIESGANVFATAKNGWTSFDKANLPFAPWMSSTWILVILLDWMAKYIGGSPFTVTAFISAPCCISSCAISEKPSWCIIA